MLEVVKAQQPDDKGSELTFSPMLSFICNKKTENIKMSLSLSSMEI
jgi:hypothetical protein